MQRERVQSEADRRGWDVEWFVDDGVSARDLSRPGIQEALEAVSGRRCSAIVVAKLDRLARSVFDLSGLLRRGEREGWGLVLLDFDLDTTTPTGKLVAHVVSAVAEFERDRLRQRTREALAVAKANGRRLGRPPVLDGDVVQRIVSARQTGSTMQSIADELNAENIPTDQGGRQWWPSTVKGVLDRST